MSEVEVTGLPGYEPRVVRQRLIAEILEPRARELFQMLRDNLRQGGVLEAMGAGCVLTGGGARLPGLLETAESLLRVQARLASPVPLSRMPAAARRPRILRSRPEPCSMPTAPARTVRRKTRDCAPSCAPFSPEVSSPKCLKQGVEADEEIQPPASLKKSAFSTTTKSSAARRSKSSASAAAAATPSIA